MQFMLKTRVAAAAMSATLGLMALSACGGHTHSHTTHSHVVTHTHSHVVTHTHTHVVTHHVVHSSKKSSKKFKKH